MGSFSIWHWLVVLVVVVLVFGTGKLKNLGKDLGGAIKGFKEGMKDGTDAASSSSPAPGVTDGGKAVAGPTIDVQAKEKT